MKDNKCSSVMIQKKGHGGGRKERSSGERRVAGGIKR